MSRSLKITVMMDEGWVPADDPELSKEEAEPLTERHVSIALRGLGHEVRILGVGYDVQKAVAALVDDPPDVVFNLVEQFRNDRRLDKNVAGLLELMRIPFTGTGSAGLMLCRDKGLCKQLLSLHKIHAPRFLLFPPGRRPYVPKPLNYPFIVKPQYEDASDGIAKSSIVRSEAELAERIRVVHERWGQVAIAEEYVDGRELYVAVLGNKRLSVLPIREIRFGDASEGAPRIATSRVKRDAAYREKWQIEYGFADLPEALGAKIARLSKKVFRLLQLRDYGRIDLRVTGEEGIMILEVNANPDIAYGEDFANSAERAGVAYEQLIDRILKLALRRYEQHPGGEGYAGPG